MGQPVVLPKFELPGDKPHWAVRAAWIVGGLLLVSIICLGAVIVHHRNAQTDAILAKEEARVRAKADADAKVAAIAAAAKAVKEAEIAAKVAQAKAAADAKAAAHAARAEAAGAEAAGDGTKSTRSGHRSRAGKAKVSVKAGGAAGPASTTAMKDKSTGGTKSNKPDAIDELLKKMK